MKKKTKKNKLGGGKMTDLSRELIRKISKTNNPNNKKRYSNLVKKSLTSRYLHTSLKDNLKNLENSIEIYKLFSTNQDVKAVKLFLRDLIKENCFLLDEIDNSFIKYLIKKKENNIVDNLKIPESDKLFLKNSIEYYSNSNINNNNINGNINNNNINGNINGSINNNKSIISKYNNWMENNVESLLEIWTNPTITANNLLSNNPNLTNQDINDLIYGSQRIRFNFNNKLVFLDLSSYVDNILILPKSIKDLIAGEVIIKNQSINSQEIIEYLNYMICDKLVITGEINEFIDDLFHQIHYEKNFKKIKKICIYHNGVNYDILKDGFNNLDSLSNNSNLGSNN